MSKVYVKKLIIKDKIYIDKTDVVSPGDLQAAFTYVHGQDIFSDLEETEDQYLLPSNSYHKLEWDALVDERKYQKLDYSISFKGSLRFEQEIAVKKLFKEGRARSGLLQAKPGWGKTFAASSLIAQNNSKTLILVHTVLLFEQWLEELSKQLGNVVIGKIGDGHFKIEDVTVAIYKSLPSKLDQVRNEFSLIIVDECHKAPADMFSGVLNNLNAKVKIGLSATPSRKDGKHVFLVDFFTPHKVVAEDLRTMSVPSVQIVPTDFKFTVKDPTRDWVKAINTLCEDEAYIQFVANKAIEYIAQGRCPLIIGDRVLFLKKLQEKIPYSICVIGETSKEVRETALKELGTTYKAILTTKLFDEGISCHRLDTLFLTCPSNNPVQWEQRIGRIERLHPDKQFPLIVDFKLVGVMVSRQQANRRKWYESKGYYIF